MRLERAAQRAQEMRLEPHRERAEDREPQCMRVADMKLGDSRVDGVHFLRFLNASCGRREECAAPWRRSDPHTKARRSCGASA